MLTLRNAALGLASLSTTTALALSGCGIEQLTQGGSSGTTSETSSATADAAAESGVTGQACGVEGESGATLCRATSQCPSLVVDSQALPHCGFRIKGGASELVCGCGESICSMGPFSTCTQAAQLLASQTEVGVCVQVAEGRCSAGTPSTGSASSGGSSTCDRTCLAECGGGAACASLCGC